MKIKSGYLIIILLVFFLLDLVIGYKDKSFYAFFLDVGQGESTLIRTPEGNHILIDTGPGKEAYEELSRYFPLGENRIDLLILSHFDKDHIGALPLILEAYNVERVIYNKEDPDYGDYWEDYLDEIPYIEDDIRVGCCVEIDILEPTKLVEGADSNMSSIAIKLSYNKLDIFLGGDIPSEMEDELASDIGDIDVLKVSHHGSRYSTSDLFIKTVKPELAMISVGENNSYGHPHPQVLALLEKNMVKVARTDISGTQVIISDGNTLEHISALGCKQFCNYLLVIRKYLLIDEHSFIFL